jgi:hypothetical protein
VSEAVLIKQIQLKRNYMEKFTIRDRITSAELKAFVIVICFTLTVNVSMLAQVMVKHAGNINRQRIAVTAKSSGLKDTPVNLQCK